MKHIIRSIPTAILFTLLLSVNTFAAVRETDVSVPDEGNVIVEVPGEFTQASPAEVLKLINSYRLEACKNGYPDPRSSSEKLTMEDYSEIKWSGDLEWIAQTRAAEGAVLQDHTRPCGYSCFSVEHNDVSASRETLAWNNGSLLGGIQQWYGEKSYWVAQNSNAVTGHYTAMISPSVKYVGIGCFTSDSGDWTCIAGAWSGEEDLSEASQGVNGRYNQKMEVPKDSLTSMSLSGADSVIAGKTGSYKPVQYVQFPHIFGYSYVNTPIAISGTPVYSVSDTSIASVNTTGVLTGLKPGSVKLSVTYPTGESASKTVKVVKPPKGTTLTVGDIRYKVTKVGSEVSFTKYTGTAAKVTVPAKVTIGGTSYKVTAVAANAFKGNKTVTTVAIGKNVTTLGAKAFYGCKKLKAVTIPAKVTKIGKQAFYGCSKMKTLTIKTTKLKSGTVGAKAFAKTGIKTVKVPKKRKAVYSSFLPQKGISKKAKWK